MLGIFTSRPLHGYTTLATSVNLSTSVILRSIILPPEGGGTVVVVFVWTLTTWSCSGGCGWSSPRIAEASIIVVNPTNVTFLSVNPHLVHTSCPNSTIAFAAI
jgi:hypothetical protein